MKLNWNTNEIETRKGCRVLQWERLYVTDPRDSRCLYEVIAVTADGYKKYVVDDCGFVLGVGCGTHDNDIVQKVPSPPRERVGWVNDFCFADPSRTCAVTFECERQRNIRVRIIEEPEVNDEPESR